jgi:microcystin-dependent protein
MSDPYLGQITMGAITFVPRGYSACNGVSIPIVQNQALYSLIGTTYGGAGTSFNLPNLNGRTPIGFGPTAGPATGLSVYSLGASGGAESVALGQTHLPTHNHSVIAGTGTSTAVLPSLIPGSVIAKSTKLPLNSYASPSDPLVQMVSKVSSEGGGQAHGNLQPFLAINYYIALQGYYPTRD